MRFPLAESANHQRKRIQRCSLTNRGYDEQVNSRADDKPAEAIVEPTVEDARNLGLKDAEDAARVVRDKLSHSSRGTPAVRLAPPGLIATGFNARLHEIANWSEDPRREYWVSLGSGLRLTEVALIEVEEPAGFLGSRPPKVGSDLPAIRA
jgi:hypothetical protein